MNAELESLRKDLFGYLAASFGMTWAFILFVGLLIRSDIKKLAERGDK